MKIIILTKKMYLSSNILIIASLANIYFNSYVIK
jgi:hypothetical protein